MQRNVLKEETYLPGSPWVNTPTTRGKFANVKHSIVSHSCCKLIMGWVCHFQFPSALWQIEKISSSTILQYPQNKSYV
eukprot:scaffold7504_cov97-Cylindrotheca_fusiformis.AAC.4